MPGWSLPELDVRSTLMRLALPCQISLPKRIEPRDEQAYASDLVELLRDGAA